MQKEQTNLCKVSWLDKIIKISSVTFRTGKCFQWCHTIKINRMDKLFLYFQLCPDMIWKWQKHGSIGMHLHLQEELLNSFHKTTKTRELKLPGVRANNWKISYMKIVSSCEKPYFGNFWAFFNSGYVLNSEKTYNNNHITTIVFFSGYICKQYSRQNVTITPYDLQSSEKFLKIIAQESYKWAQID